MEKQVGWKMRALTIAASGLTVGLLAAGASAQEIRNDVGQLQEDRREIRQDNREIRAGRRELLGDRRDLHRDVAVRRAR